MTNQEKIQLAAEKIIEFGLSGTGWTAENMRNVAKEPGACLFVHWEPSQKCYVRLHVDERKDAVRVLVEAKMVKASYVDARKHGTFLSRIAFLAQQIEEAIGQGEET